MDRTTSDPLPTLIEELAECLEAAAGYIEALRIDTHPAGPIKPLDMALVDSARHELARAQETFRRLRERLDLA